jgi:flagellar hook protein FlgE
MAAFDAFSTALSALSADSTAIDIVGNNLANLNTTGYKSQEIQFSDLMSQQLGAASSSDSVGMGVGPAQAITDFTQGTIEQASGPLDAAINGNGFFVVDSASTGQQLYTRDGSFQLSANGSLLTANGDYVQGWTATGGTLNPSGAVGNIVLPLNGVSAATATQNVSLNANLDAASTVGSSGATFSAPVQVIDSLGEAQTLTFTFTNNGNGSWGYTVTIPNSAMASGGSSTGGSSTGGSTGGNTTQIATGTLTFNSNGELTGPAPGSPIALTINGLADGAASMNINWNLYNSSGGGDLTQFAESSGVSATSQDGIAAGTITNITMGNDGVITATYSNGQQANVAQVALASIQNPESMISVGNNNLATTPETAAPAIGAAGSAGLGTVEGGALESSTVDVATQFTELMQYQNSYEAASKVVTTSDNLLQDVLALIPQT